LIGFEEACVLLVETVEYFGVVLFKEDIRKMHCFHVFQTAIVIAGQAGRVYVLMHCRVAVTMKEQLKI
jgi:hypothetical protein